MPNSDDDSDYAEYGTALEAIEEDDAARKKPIAVSEQVAVDEKGRRRFHGAFTGGFSAGYFNTVGSKEGWAPSTFKSSRADRGAFKSQNVLDFMDNEDKGAFGIAPQILRPTDDFSDKNEARERKRPMPKHSEGVIPGMPVLDQIIQPVKETVGIKILVKMGWRPGKGVGPKIDKDRKAKRAKLSAEAIGSSFSEEHGVSDPSEESSTTRRIYGCLLPPELMQQGDSEQSSDDEIEEAKALLAPDDVNSLLCNPKENTFGLGYRGLDRNTLTPATGPLDLFGTKLKFRVENKNLSISGQAFGVGAFEENDDDIYSKEDMSQYDFALETPEERKRRKAKEQQDKRKSRHKENCIEGFRASSSSSNLKRKNFPPPVLPSNFQPFHASKKSRFEISKVIDEQQDAKSKGLVRHSLTISERQVLIEDDVNKITKISTAADNQNESNVPTEPSTSSAVVPSNPTVQTDDIQRRIERLKKFTQVLQAYSNKSPEEGSKAGFKPFMKNPEKQERYEKYLTLRDAGFAECLKDLQPPEMTEWERDREKMEFERASKLYKPMNSVLASRFTSAKSHDISHLEPEKELMKQKDPKDDPKVAAQMKLFGKLTHRVVEWHPDKLVCKRFNIPHPYPDSKFVGVKGDPSIWNKDTKNATISTDGATAQASKIVEVPKKKGLFDNLDFSKPPPGLLPPGTEPPTSSTGIPSESSGDVAGSSEAVSMLEFQKQISSTNEPRNDEDMDVKERPPLDLFKEIFADSSESENEEVEIEIPARSGLKNQEKANESEHLVSQHMRREKAAARDDKPLDKTVSGNNDGKSLPPENESVNQRKEAQRRGVFDRIDLDALQNHSHHFRTSPPRRNSGSEEDIEDVYGPAPPKSAPSCAISRQHPFKSSISGKSTTASKTASSSAIHQPTHKGMFDDTKKEVDTEEVMWVEKSALSDGSTSSKSHTKSKKHSSKKSRRKSIKKEKRKSHKSKRHKHSKSKKARKHKSKRKRDSSKESGSSASDDDNSSTSDASVTINDSLDNRALLAKLKQITRSN